MWIIEIRFLMLNMIDKSYVLEVVKVFGFVCDLYIMIDWIC